MQETGTRTTKGRSPDPSETWSLHTEDLEAPTQKWECTLPDEEVRQLILDLKAADDIGDANVMGEVLVRLHEGKAFAFKHLHAVLAACGHDSVVEEFVNEYCFYSQRSNPVKAAGALVDLAVVLPVDHLVRHLPQPTKQAVAERLNAVRANGEERVALSKLYLSPTTSMFMEPLKQRLGF